MSSSKPTPTIPELLDAYAVGIQSKDDLADAHHGSKYDSLGGMGALIWARAANRDREIFRSIYLDGCRDDALDERILKLGGPARIQSVRGTGQAKLTTASPASLTAYVGTRIAVIGSAGVRYYRIAEDVSASGVSSLYAAIEAEETGPGAAVDSSVGSLRLAWEDQPISTATWTISSLRCSDGTAKETDAEYLVRYRTWKKSRRAGYADFITRRMLECGANTVVLFESHLADAYDYGVNRVFVDCPDATVLAKCRLALDSVVAFGCTTNVGIISKPQFSIVAQLVLYQKPANYNLAALNQDAIQACKRALSGNQASYIFNRDAIQAELFRAIPDLQSVAFQSPTPANTDVASLVASGGTLVKYDAGNMTTTFTWGGPS